MTIDLHDAMSYFEDLTAAVVAASRVPPDESVAGHGPNVTGGTLIRPGGRDCYPAFWVRDFAMSLDSGYITPDEAEHGLLLTAGCQADEDWETPSGSFVPRGSVADHITFDGLPIFFPGTLDDYEGQGGPWGKLPSLDDHYYFVDMAWHVAVTCGREDVLDYDVNGVRLLERLALAFSVPRVDPETELVVCDIDDRGVSFGFTDVIVHTGKLFFCSVLRQRAARRMADLFRRVGQPDRAARYDQIQQILSAQIPQTFAHPSGLLRASTGLSDQPDVWGSAFAVYAGVLTEPDADRVSRALHTALLDGTIAWRGQIRHVPTDADFSNTTAWEVVIGDRPKGTYQNGAYWGTPLGWVAGAIARQSLPDAQQLVLDYVTELQRDDFRQGPEFGAPWECMHPENDHRQNPVYMCSVTTPLGAFRHLGWGEGDLPSTENSTLSAS